MENHVHDIRKCSNLNIVINQKRQRGNIVLETDEGHSAKDLEPYKVQINRAVAPFTTATSEVRVQTTWYKAMIHAIDYENWLRTNSSSEKAADYRMSNVWFLVEALKNTLEKDEDGAMTVEEAIGKLVLRDMLERQQEEEDGAEGVQMMTLHASKGLEFPYVFIMGMEEEILPHRSSIEADTIEEERRLAYVGITRARQTLAFTFAAKRKQYGEIIDCAPSRFLDELPPDDLAWEGNDDTPTEVKAVRGNTALADIRAMLKR